MKKFLCIIFTIMILCLSACNTQPSSSANSTITNPPSTTATSSTENSTAEAIPLQNTQLPLPNDGMEFSFLSGAGGWRSLITLNRDGSFTGFFLDSEMGDVGEGYPNGSAYICEFSGKFANIEKIDEYSYKMTLAEVTTEKPIGEEWIEEDIRYVASEPHGLYDSTTGQPCTEFIFYLPDTPIDQLSEEFLTWWPYRYDQDGEAKTTLSCYGILNVATNFGFFTAD